MPIYEYYCPNNHTIYQFYAKTLAQGLVTPKCPDNPRYRMTKVVSSFAVTSGGKSDEATPPASVGGSAHSPEDARMEAALGAMEKEFSRVDENDPRAMARMMRRMSDLTGEKIDGEMEEVVRKLEEGTDPEALEEQMGVDAGNDELDPSTDGMAGETPPADPNEPKHRFRARRAAMVRDPQLYDYE